MDLPYNSPLGRVALGDFLRRTCARRPSHAAVVDGDRVVSYEALYETALRFANYLIGTGLKPGDRVAMLCNNSADMIAAISALHIAGLVWVPVNTMLSDEDHKYILDHCGARVLIADAAMLTLANKRALVADLGLTVVAIGSGKGPDDVSFDAAVEQSVADEPDVALSGESLAFIMYTSGTTARPKGVMHSHLGTVLALLVSVNEIQAMRDDVSIAVLPLFHVAQYITTFAELFGGGTTIVARGFDPGAILGMIEQHRVTRLLLLPMMYGALLQHPALDNTDRGSLRVCIWGMAPMSGPMLEQLKARLCPNFMLGTGQTEMLPLTAAFRPGENPGLEGNYWGRPTILNDLAIMGPDGDLLPPGQEGEIVHRGPNVMLGYFRNDEETTKARAHGWHHTGDLGVIKENGQLLFADRLKDMIKSGGENVSSVKVEQALLRHPAVAAAAAIATPDDQWGEAVCVHVILAPGIDRDGDGIPDEAMLITHCRQHLGRFEVPKRVIFHETLPMTATGKVKKNELRDAALTSGEERG